MNLKSNINISESELNQEIFTKIKWLTNNFSSEEVKISLITDRLKNKWINWFDKIFKKENPFFTQIKWGKTILTILKNWDIRIDNSNTKQWMLFKFKKNEFENGIAVLDKVTQDFGDSEEYRLFSSCKEWCDELLWELNEILDFSWNILEEDWKKIITYWETKYIKYKVLWIIENKK